MGKWKGLKQMYKKVKDHNNQSGNDPKNWEHFNEMDEILCRRPEVTPKAVCSGDNEEVLVNVEGNQNFDFDGFIIDESVFPPARKTPKKKKANVNLLLKERMHRDNMQMHKENIEKQKKFLDMFSTLVNQNKPPT